MTDVGIYIVTLLNDHPISVNAQDRRMADRCIKVTRATCKVRKAKSFVARERNYHKTFGLEYVGFSPIAFTSDLRAAESAILRALLPWRMRSSSKRLTEWLEGIGAADAQQRAIAALVAAGVAFSLPQSVAR